MRHIAEKSAFCFIGRFCSNHCLLCRHTQSVQFLVVLLLAFYHLYASLYHNDTDESQHNQNGHNSHNSNRHSDGGVHHIHGTCCNILSRDQQHQSHVVRRQRCQTVIILGLFKQNICSNDPFGNQMFPDFIERPILNIFCLFQSLENILSPNDVVLRIVVGKDTVLLNDIGCRITTIALSSIIMFQGLDVLQQHHMGKSVFILNNGNGLIQLLGKCEESPVHIAGISNEGMAFFSVCKAADIIPNAHISVNQMSCSHGIQKHHPAVVKVCAKILLQHTDCFRQFLFILVMLSFNGGFNSGDKIPVCLQTSIHIGPNLRNHFLQL